MGASAMRWRLRSVPSLLSGRYPLLRQTVRKRSSLCSKRPNRGRRLTELGDSELGDRQIRAISRHKSSKVLNRYVKKMQKQIVDGTHKRRAVRPVSVEADDQQDLFGRGKGG